MAEFKGRLKAYLKRYGYMTFLYFFQCFLWKQHSSWLGTLIFAVIMLGFYFGMVGFLSRLVPRMTARQFYKRNQYRRNVFPKRQFYGIRKAQPTAPQYQRVGFRFASLVLKNGDLKLESITTDVQFGVREEAVCSLTHQRDQHMAPDAGCSCGWYSRKTVAGLGQHIHYAEGDGTVLLMCSYTGKIIPGTTGTRAQTQEVLKVWLPNRCCATGCTDPTTVMGTSPTALNSKLSMIADFMPDEPAFFAELHQIFSRPLQPFCTEHAAVATQIFSLADLRNALPTEFTFASE